MSTDRPEGITQEEIETPAYEHKIAEIIAHANKKQLVIAYIRLRWLLAAYPEHRDDILASLPQTNAFDTLRANIDSNTYDAAREIGGALYAELSRSIATSTMSAFEALKENDFTRFLNELDNIHQHTTRIMTEQGVSLFMNAELLAEIKHVLMQTAISTLTDEDDFIPTLYKATLLFDSIGVIISTVMQELYLAH
ncbi:MAG: hypothetical protein JXR42_03035 [Gammaproteobacteria bacterium]|nr:hypothetical protein [Gammaproteobacteria bacterium]